MLTKVLMLIIFLFLIPVIIGLPFYLKNINESKIINLIFSYVRGFFAVLAIYEILCASFILLNVSFSMFAIAFTVLISLLTMLKMLIVIKWVKDNSGSFLSGLSFPKFKHNFYSYLYVIGFLVLLVIQIYGAINYSSTVNSIDDATYIVYSTDAVEHNSMYMTNTYTGEFGAVGIKRILQTYNLFPAYISYMTGISVATVAHTVLNVVFLIMAYMVYYLIAYDLLYDKDKAKSSQENIWIFLIFISLLYIFGYYSHSSLSFRLLGALWQGKAVLAVVVTPFIFLIMKRFLTEEYRVANGVYLVVLSIALVSLSLMAVAHILLGVCLTTLIVSIVKRDWKKLWYIPWASIVPMLVGIVYLLDRV